MKRKRILISLIVMIIVSLQSISFAKENIGTVNFLAYEPVKKQAVANMEVNIYYVGCQEGGAFVFAKGFEDSNLNIVDYTESNIAKIKEYAVKNASPILTKITDSEGKFTINDVENGLYIFIQASNFGTCTMQDTLGIMPEDTLDDEVNYNILVKPKIAIRDIEEPEEPVKPEKVDEPELPNTGMLNWPIPVFTVVGVVLFSIGWIITFTSNKKKLD